ncbi:MULTISPECIES: DUF4846 domain-containing protein [Rhodomicrobium]|uniref:DUF4846 domain-containing protein n=1 Tax=Rhodomicrobium TaxID=1068 RepID=UPI001FD981F8|nr:MULTISPECIES: DUF4846 domain-containing protein [Rhodomicrobium]
MRAIRIRHGIAMALLAAAAATAAPVPAGAAPRYLWLEGNAAPASAAATLAGRIAPPPGFERLPAEPGSFAEWLRNLPLRPPETPVRLYDGRLKWSQDRHAAVIDIDTGTRNLQQCADAIMRLRAEFLLASGRACDIAFNDSNGKRLAYRGAAADRKAFQRYMIQVFSYAGTYSLEREMRRVPLAEMRIGDVFIKGGFPGHAVLVGDMAANPATGERRFLLIQSYMPAQDMHVLKNPKGEGGTPWYPVPAASAELITPEWIFPPAHLRRFKE